MLSSYGLLTKARQERRPGPVWLLFTAVEENPGSADNEQWVVSTIKSRRNHLHNTPDERFLTLCLNASCDRDLTPLQLSNLPSSGFQCPLANVRAPLSI